MRKLRVLTISKPYVAASYRQKLQIWADDPRLELGLITPPHWAGQAFEPSPEDRYWLRTLPVIANGKNHFHLYRGLAKCIEEFQPDLINCEEEHYSAVTYQCLRLARKVGAKFCFYTWQNIDKSYPPPFSWIEHAVFHGADFAFAGNQEAIDILRRKGYQKPVYKLPQMGANQRALELAQKQPIALRFAFQPQRFYLAFAGRLVAEKGIQDILRAMHTLKDPDIELILLGDGPYQAELRALGDQLGLSAKLHFLGSCPTVEIYHYLREVDALILPSHTKSNWKEQFGRILVEAMLSGVPVIGSDSGEIPLVIRGAGLVYTEQNTSQLAARIAELKAKPKLASRLAAKGLARAQRLYTNEVIAQAFTQAFLLHTDSPGSRR